MLRKTLLFISCLYLTACSTQSKSQSTLRLNLGSDISTLDPRQAADNYNYIAVSLLYDGLFRIGPDQKPHFAICENYSVSEDQTIYTFCLRKAKWANGKLITAQDFAYSWLTSLNPLNPSPNAYQLFMIKNANEYFANRANEEDVGICVIDDMTLQVTLNHPTPFFIEILCNPPFYPVNSHAAKMDANWHKRLSKLDLTNGPFKLKTWVPNDRLVFEKSPLYWDKKHISLNRIEFSMIEDANTELQLFEKGELDWAGGPISQSLPLASIETLKKRHLLQNSDPYTVSWLLFNTTQKPFDHKKFRRAFSLSLNRKELMEFAKLQNNFLPQSLFPPLMSLGKHYFEDADTQQAKQLFQEALEESNLTKETLPTITIHCPSSEDVQKLVEIVQQQWEKTFDISIKLEKVDWPVYMSLLQQRQFNVGFISWAPEYDDLYYFLNIFKSKENTLNFPGWENKTFKALLDIASAATNTSLRKDLLKRAETIISNEMPMTPTYYRGDDFVVNPQLKGFYFTHIGNLELAYSYFEQ
ncbi:MAG: Oligopeptide-binding protein OppA [Chlamydiae bacterium]|nr:Oligopeptide-binding protein OppA [Chlamydiota bacterium]